MPRPPRGSRIICGLTVPGLEAPKTPRDTRYKARPREPRTPRETRDEANARRAEVKRMIREGERLGELHK